MNIYVGNLSYEVTSKDLENTFAPFGNLVSAKVVTDRDSGRSKGFGFVEYESKDAGQKAIEELNGRELKGRAITVNEARPKEPRSDHRGGGGGRPGGGGGGGGNRPPRGDRRDRY